MYVYKNRFKKNIYIYRTHIYIYQDISSLYHPILSAKALFDLVCKKKRMSSRARNPLETHLHGAVGA